MLHKNKKNTVALKKTTKLKRYHSECCRISAIQCGMQGFRNRSVIAERSSYLFARRSLFTSSYYNINVKRWYYLSAHRHRVNGL